MNSLNLKEEIPCIYVSFSAPEALQPKIFHFDFICNFFTEIIQQTLNISTEITFIDDFNNLMLELMKSGKSYPAEYSAVCTIKTERMQFNY